MIQVLFLYSHRWKARPVIGQEAAPPAAFSAWRISGSESSEEPQTQSESSSSTQHSNRHLHPYKRPFESRNTDERRQNLNSLSSTWYEDFWPFSVTVYSEAEHLDASFSSTASYGSFKGNLKDGWASRSDLELSNWRVQNPQAREVYCCEQR